MEHELNHLCGVIERQHGIIESLARLASPAGRKSVAVTLDRDRLVEPPERARPRMGTAVTRRAMPGRPLVAPAGTSCFSLRHRGVPVCAVPAFGLGGDDLAALVGAVALLQAERKDFKPVFITDNPDLEPFIRRAFAVEYVPSGRLAPAAREGLLRKLRAIREKWNIDGIWDFGRDTEFFCPICSSREFRVAAPRSTACAACGGFEWHRELARWCLECAGPGTRVICPTPDQAIEAIGRNLDLDIVATSAARFLSPERRDRSSADLIMLCSPRDDEQLREESVLPAAWHYLDGGGKVAAAYWEDGGRQAELSEPASIPRDLLGRWDISVHPRQSGNAQLDLVPELCLMSAARSPRVELVTATRKPG
jgi:hypothetical protein